MCKVKLSSRAMQWNAAMALLWSIIPALFLGGWLFDSDMIMMKKLVKYINNGSFSSWKETTKTWLDLILNTRYSDIDQ